MPNQTPMARSLVLAALAASLYGCAGAPSFSLFSAYFPLWLLSALLGIAGAIVSYRIFVMTGWADTIRYQLLVNTAIGLISAPLATAANGRCGNTLSAEARLARPAACPCRMHRRTHRRVRGPSRHTKAQARPLA